MAVHLSKNLRENIREYKNCAWYNRKRKIRLIELKAGILLVRRTRRLS